MSTAPPSSTASLMHSYYLTGNVLADILASIDGWAQNDPRRQRNQSGALANVWVIKK